MERKRFRPGLGLIPAPRLALALALLAAPMATGCSSSLETARLAWDDGEGEFEDAEEWYKAAIDELKTLQSALDKPNRAQAVMLAEPEDISIPDGNFVKEDFENLVD